MVSPSPLQLGRNTEEEKRYRQHKQNDTDDEDPSLEVLFEHADRPGPMSHLKTLILRRISFGATVASATRTATAATSGFMRRSSR